MKPRHCLLPVLLSVSMIARSQSWLITGNAGTNLATNFLGTTDNQPLKIRINNTWHGLLSTNNIFLGKNAGINNPGYSNIAIGNGALFSMTTESNVIAIGDSAMYKSVDGPAGGAQRNTVIGSKALFNNIDGEDNTIVGYRAGYSLTGGDGNAQNTAVGAEALHSATGQWNTAIGYQVLYSGNSSVYNTGVGYMALRESSAYWNTAIGSLSLWRNTTGLQNTASGSEALSSNTTGNNNTAAGFRALTGNTDGYSNVAVGVFALNANKSRHNLVAVGDSALYNNGASATFSGSEGSFSTAVGSKSLYSNTNGYGNTAVGYRSLFNNTTGYYNTAIGYNAYPINATLNNYTGIGYYVGSFSSTSNSVEIGNSSVTWIGGQVGWSTYSDGRIKEQVKEDIKGLEFIRKLRPVSYNLNIHRQHEIVHAGGRSKSEEKEWPEKYAIETKRISGFIAQEVEEAAKQAGYDFPGVRKPQTPQELYSLTYSDFVVPLVKAIQEQQELIERLEKRIQELEKRTAVPIVSR